MKRKVIGKGLIKAFFLLLSAKAISQDAGTRKTMPLLTLHEKNITLKELFNLLLNEKSIRFRYNAFFQDSVHISVDVENITLDSLVRICIRGQHVIPEIPDEFTVYLNPMPVIKGMVTGAGHEPLPYATIHIKGGRKIIADSSGYFTLSSPTSKLIVTVSFASYFSLKTEILAGRTNTIELKPDGMGKEYMTIGYGTVNKRLGIAGISQIRSKEINTEPVSDFLTVSQGRMPGLQVNTPNGLSGSVPSLLIRGQSSIALGNSPLILIDGVPFTPIGPPSATGSHSALGDHGLSIYNSINPRDIESITVLKDASATAIYGSRGANGVILITTKKGEAGKKNFAISLYQGFSSIVKIENMLTNWQYLLMREEALRNDKLTANSVNAPDLRLWDISRNTNITKILLGGQALITDVSVSFSGGDSSFLYWIAAGHHRETTVFPGDFGNARESIHANIQHWSPDKRIHTEFSWIYSHVRYILPMIDPSFYITMAPDAPALTDASGKLNWQQNGLHFYNPLAALSQLYNASTNNQLEHFQLDYLLVKGKEKDEGLTFRLSIGHSSNRTNETNKIPIASQDPGNNPEGSLFWGLTASDNFIVEPFMEYTGHKGKSKLNGLLGGTLQWQQYDSSSVSAGGFTSDATLEMEMISTANTAYPSSYLAKYHYEAVFARLIYSWNEKYVLEASGRRDGSSRFGPAKRFGNFGAAGAAWIFSEEKWFRDLSLLKFGKLRASYGTSGNDQIGENKYSQTWANTPTLAYGVIQGIYPTTPAGPGLTWETSRKLELNLELGLFNDRLHLSTAFYRNRSTSQLIQYTLPLQTAYSSVLRNLNAVVQNKGWEFTLYSTILSGKLDWSISSSLTIPRNTLLAFPDLDLSSYSNILVPGESLHVIRTYGYQGVDPALGIFTVKDLNNDGIIDNKDIIIAGNSDIRYYGGISNSLKYKRWGFDIFFQFKKQIAISDIAYFYNQNVPGSINSAMLSNQPVSVLGRWKMPGDHSAIEQFTSTETSAAFSATNNFTNSTGAWTDASYIRLKTLAISYKILFGPSKKNKPHQLCFSLKAENLLTLTHFHGADPETQSPFIVPPMRTLVMEMRITL